MKRLQTWKITLGLLGLLGLLGMSLPLAAQGTSQSGYQKLGTLDKEFLKFTKPKLVDGIRDYGSDAMKALPCRFLAAAPWRRLTGAPSPSAGRNGRPASSTLEGDVVLGRPFMHGVRHDDKIEILA